MKVFISWSGERSRKLAEFLAGWLKKLPLAIEPWVSKDAIDPGTRWGKELAEALEGTSFGILCITSENQREPWISFEAGALSKTIDKSYVVPYLIGMKPAEIEQPLKQFQAIEANEQDTWKLIETIYMASGDKTRTIKDLEEAFKMWWPKLMELIEIVKKDFLDNVILIEEPTMSDIKTSLDKALKFMESISIRLTTWEISGGSSKPIPTKEMTIGDLVMNESSKTKFSELLSSLTKMCKGNLMLEQEIKEKIGELCEYKVIIQ